MAPLFLAAAVGLGLVVASRKRPVEPKAIPHPAMAIAHATLPRVAQVLGVPTPRLRAVSGDGLGWARGNVIELNPHALARELARCPSRAGAYGVLVWLLAHETAHIIGRDGWAPLHERVAREHRADWYAGYALARLAQNVDLVAAAIARLNYGCTPTHGCDFERIAALRAGYVAGQMDLVAA